MDINILIQRLRHGESYTAQDAEGNPYTVTRPPTSLSIKAAEMLIKQSNQIEQVYETSQNLMRQLNNLNEHYDLLYKTRTPPETSTETGPEAGNPA